MSDILKLTATETDALKRMHCGEDGDDATDLRWVDTDIVDTWRHGNIYLIIVTHQQHEGLWGVKVKQGEGDEPWNDLDDREAVTLKRAYAIPSVTYTLHPPVAQS